MRREESSVLGNISQLWGINAGRLQRVVAAQICLCEISSGKRVTKSAVWIFFIVVQDQVFHKCFFPILLDRSCYSFLQRWECIPVG